MTIYEYLQTPNRMKCIIVDKETGKEIKFYPPNNVYLDACKRLEIKSTEKFYQNDTYYRIADMTKEVAKTTTRRRVYLKLYVQKLDGFDEIYNKLWR